MIIQPFTASDFPALKDFQPPGWPDILPSMRFYVEASYCYPVKVSIGKQLTGIGAAILHKNSGWLAHIIVHPEYRNKGIGTFITDELVALLRKLHIPSILLIASMQGESLYRKLIFTKEAEYPAFKNEQGPLPPRPCQYVTHYEDRFKKEVFALDRFVSGELRQKLLTAHLPTSRLHVLNNELDGCYFPFLGEGLILARNNAAGLDLMHDKHTSVTRAVIPAENRAGIDFLLSNNFIEASRGARMWLGKPVQWKPENLYSRIGGNLG